MSLSSDPDKIREWQRRARQRDAQRRAEGAGASFSTGSPQAADKRVQRRKAKPKRHNDGPWRKQVMELHGERCKACGDTRHVEADHVIPKSQDSSARHDVLNGLPLCGAFSANTPGGCHPKKTDGELRFDIGWFTPAQLAYLADKGWVDWDEEGEPFGRGWRHFNARQGGDHGNEEGRPVPGSSGERGGALDPWGCGSLGTR